MSHHKQLDRTSQYIRTVKKEVFGQVRNQYPFTLPAVKSLSEVELHPNVTFLAGENGSGKSTLLEAIAVAFGYNPEGGTRSFNFSTESSHSSLGDYLTLVRGISRPKDGFFLRAESFYNVATYIDELDRELEGGKKIISSYGGKFLHQQSHGESFMALFLNRLTGKGLYILDEPEAALSPMRQMAFISRMHDLVCDASQFIIATHSPIIMAYPNAYILNVEQGYEVIEYRNTEHYRVTYQFLTDTERMLKILTEDSEI